MYSIQYLAKNNHKGTWPSTYSKTCGDHGPGLDTKERKTMPKKKKKLIHIRKSRSNPEKYKHLKAVSKIQIQIYAKKKKKPRNSVQTKKKNRKLYNPKSFIHIRTS